MTGFSIEPGSLVAGEITHFVVGIALTNPLPIDASILVFLPQMLNDASNWTGGVTIVDSSFNGTIAYGETSPGTVNITRLSDGTEIPAGTVVKVNISQVKNIPHSGDVGDYNVSTKQSDGTFIDFTDEVSNEPIFVPATLVGGSVAVANNSKAKAGQEGTLHFRITLSSNPLPANGKIRIGLPTGTVKTCKV